MHSKCGQCWEHSVNVISMSTTLLADFIQAMKRRIKEEKQKRTYAGIHTHHGLLP